jgi:predicted secreted protein
MKKHTLFLLVAVGLIGSASAAIDNWTFGNGGNGGAGGAGGLFYDAITTADSGTEVTVIARRELGGKTPDWVVYSSVTGILLAENGGGPWQAVGAYAPLIGRARSLAHPSSAEYQDTEINDVFPFNKALYSASWAATTPLPTLSYQQANGNQVTFYIKKHPAVPAPPIIIPASDGATSWSEMPGITPSVLTLDQRYVLQLPSKPSSGYKWTYTQLPLGYGPLDLGKPVFTRDSKALGSGGTENLPIYTFKTGNAQLLCSYGRTGEPPIENLYFSFYVEPVLTQSDASTGTNPVVVVQNGQNFAVQLSVNAGTGFTWVNTSTSPNLSAGNPYNLPAQNQNSVGGPVTTMYPFTGNSVGAGSVQFTEFDPGSNAVQVLNFPALVTPAPLVGN